MVVFMSEVWGFQRLAIDHNVQPVQPLFSRSTGGSMRRREAQLQGERLVWPAHYKPDNSFRGHMEFGLKYERLNLELLSRLFARVDPGLIARWVEQEPTGRYARRTAFFYEWLTGKTLPVPDTASNVAYVDALDARLYWTAPQGSRNRRWRVHDNLPGTREFCPLVYLGPEAERDWLYDVALGVQQLDERFGPELLLRSAAWLTFKESRASFAIEREGDRNDRVRRFAAAIAAFSGRLSDPLSAPGLLTLQKAVLGDRALRLGIRQSPVFVGQNAFDAPVVHYVAPESAWLPAMLKALHVCEQRTRGSLSLVRAAALSFAFVYLHPLADGNGRVHRFFLNHWLAADAVVPAQIIIPVSATIAASTRSRARYDDALEVLSVPFMQRYAAACRFGRRRVCPDGVETDFEFEQSDDAAHVWRYPDLTRHVAYVSELLHQTIETDMALEAHALRRHDVTIQAIKQVIEMPDADAERILRSLRHENWQVSNALRKAFSEIFQPSGRLYPLHEALVLAARDTWLNDAHAT